MERFIIIRNVHLKEKNNQKGPKHKHSRKPKNKIGAKRKNSVYSTKTENTEIKMKRKFVKVQMSYIEVEFQLDTGSDVTLIN